MSDQDDRDLQQLLRGLKRVPQADPPPDLWPRMLRRLDRRTRGVPWPDWVVAALVLVALSIVPSAIPLLLFHL